MRRHGISVTRRSFLKTTAGTLALAPLHGFGNLLKGEKKRNKMILSFYLDDTSPDRVPAGAYKEFLDYCHANGIKGETSFIAGYNGKSIFQEQDENHRLYIDQVKMAYSKGIDSNMEIMTHDTLFDFKTGMKNETGIHEGLWLHEPGVKEEEYQAYFSGIIAEAEKKGIKFSGLTWPGCGCEACTRRYAELKSAGPLHINDAVFKALLELARDEKFRRRVISIFYEANETEFGIFRRAADGKYGVYDLMPNANDKFGIWENSQEHVDADYFITEDGKTGIIIKHLENNNPYCMWYMHWQGVNPHDGVGWEAFKTVTERINKYLADRVIWMSPGDIVTAYHKAGSWDFTGKL